MLALGFFVAWSLSGLAPADGSTTAEPEPPPKQDDGDGIPDLGELDALPGQPPQKSGPESDASSQGIPDLGDLESLGGGGTAPDGVAELGSLDGAPAGKTVESAPRSVPGENDEAPAHQGETFGDIFTGSMRLTGAFLHFDDVPQLFPAGDDALLASVFRVIAKRDLGRRFGVEMNYFLDLSRTPGGGATAGAFATAGSAGSVYRSPYLQWRFWNDGSVAGSLGADRFVFDVDLGPVDIAVGRLPITYTVAGLFTPNDFFSPFSASAVNRIYKPGVDAVRVSAGIGMNAAVEVVGVMGNDDGGNPSWARTGLLARASSVRWGFEWAALGGKVAERWVAGASSQGDVGPVTLRAEGHLGVPDRDGDGRGVEDEDDDIHVRLATGPSVNVGWRNMILGAEYAFISDGARRASTYLDRALRQFPDDQPQLARHYVGVNANVEIVPILNGAVFTLLNANDASGLAGFSLIYNVADEADIIAGLFTPWGGDPSFTGDPTRPIVLDSEFGASPLTVYLEARAFF